jgi:Docking domain of Afi1 for Arf3 in vesicle trafficking
VEYILVASFDIDRGPIMEHQYPGAISPDENMLAELMLPDQTHVRTQDWTMFFLHKDAAVEEEETAEKQARREKRRERRAANENALLNGQPQEEDLYSDDTDTEDEEDGREGPPLMYVLNLVNTKQDNTAKRSATTTPGQSGKR